MELVTEGPLKVAWITGKIRFPVPSITVVAKGTFDLVPGAIAAPAAEPFLPRGDEFADDNPEGVLKAPNDLVPFKPRTDLFLTGTCHAPGGKPTTTCTVAFGVGAFSWKLAVIGDRVWKRKLLGGSLTEPQPFRTMPISYDRAFGGPGYAKNPLGRGWDETASEVSMPNIEDPGQLVLNPKSKPDPAGFGPIPLPWPQRMSRAGTYGKKWQKNRWPYLAEDLDWRFFNAAPDSQQPEGYLRGDEEVTLENLHPEIPLFRSRLPALRARAFLLERITTRERFHEVPLVLDTLGVDADSSKLVLVWRGNQDARDDKLYGFQYLYVVSEKLSEAARSSDYYRKRLEAILEERKEAEMVPPLAPLTPPPPPPPLVAPQTPEPPLPTGDAELAQAEAETKKAIAKLGPHAPSGPPPTPSPEELEKSLVDLLQRAAGKLKGANRPVPEGLAALLATPPKIALPEEEAPPAPEPPVAPGAHAPAPKPLTREEILERIRTRASLEGEDMTGAKLSGLDLSGMNLKKALLTGADLSGAKMEGTDLSGAFLSKATLTAVQASGATLRGADLVRATMSRADLSKAALEEADLSESDLSRASLSKAMAAGARFARANLVRADLEGADLTKADLTQCRLHGANLSSAVLQGALLLRCWGRALRAEKARFSAARLNEAVLTEGRFADLQGDGSLWHQAHLFGSDFSRARLAQADFTEALLDRCRFPEANLRNGRFVGASLRGAEMVRANLFRSDLTRTDLSGADFRQANLYETDFWEAKAETAAFQGANLKKSTLAARES